MMVDPEWQSVSYTERVMKYHDKKGFTAIVPMLLRKGIDMDTLATRGGGIAALLRREHNLLDSKSQESPHRDVDYTGSIALRIRAIRKKGVATGKDQHWFNFLRIMKREISALEIDGNASVALHWMTTNPMRQGPVSGTFHPCHEEFYNAYMAAYDRIRDMIDDQSDIYN